MDDARLERHTLENRSQPGGGGSRMIAAAIKNQDLLIAASTIWVVITAVLVMFMQAGFAFLEAGLTRMKNAGHIAGKNVLIFAICSIVYWAVGFAIVWGAMAERAKLWVYFAFGVAFTLIYSITSHWIWSPHGWLFHRGMQDFAGSTVVHYQGALAGLAGALLLGPRIGKFGTDGRANPIPGHNIPYAVLGTLILWFGWFGFNPGSTLSVDFGGFGYFAYVAITTNIAAAAGAVGGLITAWVVLKKPDISMMLNGVIAALVAITAASGFVAPWAAIVIGLVAGGIAVVGVIVVERIGIDDPIGAVAVHGMAGVWGTLATGIFAVPLLAKNLATGTGGLVYTGSFHQFGVQALGLLAVGVWTFSASFGILWTLKKLWGIRVEDEAETIGLDVSEHGMWGYPEFYIPVPGGYGTEAHSHVGNNVGPSSRTPPEPALGTTS